VATREDTSTDSRLARTGTWTAALGGAGRAGDGIYGRYGSPPAIGKDGRRGSLPARSKMGWRDDLAV
jgi:hypothetical protein